MYVIVFFVVIAHRALIQFERTLGNVGVSLLSLESDYGPTLSTALA
jgi:hypothetical protein